MTKELSDKSVTMTINRLFNEKSRIKRSHTFVRDVYKHEKVTSFTHDSKTATKIERIYQRGGKCSYKTLLKPIGSCSAGLKTVVLKKLARFTPACLNAFLYYIKIAHITVIVK